MKILITGGNTSVFIDKVRVISNVFKGKTAMNIAQYAWSAGDTVTVIGNSGMDGSYFLGNSRFLEYKTFDELESLMKYEIQNGNYDCVIHSAAVSDYKVSAVLDENLQVLDSSKKVGSDHSKMYLELTPTKKLIDEIRPWGFKGKLVKFKLQVGISDEELLTIAKKSREHSDADIIVANCLEWSRERAYIVTADEVIHVNRNELASKLLEKLQ